MTDKPLHSEQINEISAALSKAQMEINSAEKDSTNPHFRSSFASLHSHWEACREALGKNNLMITQLTTIEDDKNILITILSHSSGQWFKSYYQLLPVKNDPQGMGSCLSYARRYMLSAIIGTTASDDDGEAAMDRNTPPAANVAISPKKPAPKHKTITEAQAKELDAMLGMCDLKFQDQVWDFLGSDAVGIKEMKQLPEALYQKIRDKIDNKINEAGKDKVKDGTA